MSAKKILIIDDEEQFCRSLKKSLELKGDFHVLTATRGNVGVKLAKTQKPDLILLDVMMPDMAGSHVAEELSEDPATQSIPVIFVTAIVTQEEMKESGGFIGGYNFIAKPIIISELIKTINAIMPI
jgi:putative two-component system response regulator